MDGWDIFLSWDESHSTPSPVTPAAQPVDVEEQDAITAPTPPPAWMWPALPPCDDPASTEPWVESTPSPSPVAPSEDAEEWEEWVWHVDDETPPVVHPASAPLSAPLEHIGTVDTSEAVEAITVPPAPTPASLDCRACDTLRAWGNPRPCALHRDDPVRALAFHGSRPRAPV